MIKYLNHFILTCHSIVTKLFSHALSFLPFLKFKVPDLRKYIDHAYTDGLTLSEDARAEAVLTGILKLMF